ncbi:putative transcription factor interactor and regulator CCHC(Zn) family [Rosa chinensis]|uniref:Putative transcription factor interactor and regulator CCHC(Zn) family n=1 Tax=Rosa chinensis TaxID=74649 RepID=A0A2P6QG55_ROSCH|nr:uncharacterized protein LOC112166780 isoform X1 [Rosa chinensis]PRQ33147.1 putative transcription factor interactor and regulator CCHC(Zn) family [Rosa chinensis]
MPTQISYSRGAREVKVEEVILKLRSDLSQKSSNSLQISRPREINIQGGVLTVEDWQEKFRYVKSGYGHGHGENPTQQIDKDPDENPTPQINKDPEINIEAGGSGKSTDNPPARSWEDESYDDMLLHIYGVPFADDEFDGPLARCELCGQTVSHYAASCPYLVHLPHHITLPRGYDRACKCCGRKDGHPGQKWEGFAIRKYCFNCCQGADHWDGDPECPNKKQRVS